MESYEKTPLAGGASESFWNGDYRAKNNNETNTRQALELAETRWLRACRRATAQPTPYNLSKVEEYRAAFIEAWGQSC